MDIANMKKILFALAITLAGIVHADPTDVIVRQRNVADTAYIDRFIQFPAGGANCLLALDGPTVLPKCFLLGTGLSLTSGVLSATGSTPSQADWTATTGPTAILNKPTISTVGMTGSYGDLTGAPTIPAAQVNADWAAASGVAQILNKPVLFSGVYSDLSGKPSLFSGAYADLSGKPTLFDGAYSSLTGIPSTFAPATHTQAWSTITGTPTTLSGYGISDGVTSAALTSTLSGYATTGALTTGLAGKFATPAGTTSQYVRGDGSLATLPAAGVGTVTSVTAGTGLSGGTITGTGTISLPNTGTAGTYLSVTTDAQGRVTSGTNASQSAATRTLNSAFQASATRPVLAIYSVRITTTVSIGSNQDGDVILEIASDSGFTSNVQTLAIGENGQVVTLAIALNSVQTQTVVVSGFIPAGYYARLRTVNVTGTPAFAYRAGQETVM